MTQQGAVWPKRLDGSNKTIGEMTREEAREQTRIACARLRKEFEHPVHQAAMEKYLNGEVQ